MNAGLAFGGTTRGRAGYRGVLRSIWTSDTVHIDRKSTAAPANGPATDSASPELLILVTISSGSTKPSTNACTRNRTSSHALRCCRPWRCLRSTSLGRLRHEPIATGVVALLAAGTASGIACSGRKHLRLATSWSCHFVAKGDSIGAGFGVTCAIRSPVTRDARPFDTSSSAHFAARRTRTRLIASTG